MLCKAHAALCAALLLAACQSTHSALPTAVQPQPNHAARAVNSTNNAIFLDHGFMVNPLSDAGIARVVRWLAQRRFVYQLHNVTTLNSDGGMNPTNYSQLARWIRVSRATDPAQKIVIYLSGSLALVNNPATWDHIAAVCKRFFTQYGVDGINLDFEPYRRPAANYLGLFGAIRKAVGPQANLSLDYTIDQRYTWSAADYRRISALFNVIMPMDYDTGCKTSACYKTVLDRALTFQSAHIAPSAALFPLVPTYARSSVHDPAVENICTAAAEIRKLAASSRITIGGLGIWWYFGWNHAAQTRWRHCWLSP